MAARYLEDLRIGEAWEGNAIPITQDAVIAFAEAYDPQPMHVDPGAAAAGRFGGIIASGWHVAALVMRDYVETSPFGDTPLLGLQVDALRWQAVRPGDVLRARREILEIIPSRSRPDRGLVRIGVTVTNQHGRTALSYSNLVQIAAGPAAETRTR